MSLFGTSPPIMASSRSLFDDEPKPAAAAAAASYSSALFSDDEGDGSRARGTTTITPSSDNNTNNSSSLSSDGGLSSPWAMPAPRRQRSRADLVRGLLSRGELPESYVAAFEREAAGQAAVGPAAVASVFAAARLDPDLQAKVIAVMAHSAPGAERDGPAAAAAAAEPIAYGREEFGVLLALVALAQEGEVVSLDGVDERRRNLPIPKLAGLTTEPFIAPVVEISPSNPAHAGSPSPAKGRVLRRPTPPPPSPLPPPQPAMEYPDPEVDPWGIRNDDDETGRAGKLMVDPSPNGGGGGGPMVAQSNGMPLPAPPSAETGPATPPAAHHPVGRTASTYAVTSDRSALSPTRPAPASTAGWEGFYDGNSSAAAAMVGSVGRPSPSRGGSGPAPARLIAGPGGPEEAVSVSLMPEKEGVFLFQHHNYEVTSPRRSSKVIRRYSDFVWLLDCLHRRYPFRVLPLLPPKRVAVNGNHLSNDGAFIEKRRRGLARFLNGLVRHPVLSQEQMVVMFLTVPTELAVWRKQATISVQDEFDGRPLPGGLEESLPPTLEELFERTRAGVRRSAELHISLCNVMDRLVKRTEGVAADHARIAVSLASLIDATADTYATDPSDSGPINDGLSATSRHLRASQGLMEDEAGAWDAGVLEDLKRQRDALVSVRDMFDRRDRLDRDNIPTLERRIEVNETKLVGLQAKPDGRVRLGEADKIAEAIRRDKESIVAQHARSVFVRECIRDELGYFQASQYYVTRWSQDWAQERVKYAEMQAENWRRLLDELERMPTEPGR